jgi:hypothetical protein
MQMYGDVTFVDYCQSTACELHTGLKNMMRDKPRTMIATASADGKVFVRYFDNGEIITKFTAHTSGAFVVQQLFDGR